MTAFSISFAMFSLRFFLYSVIEDPLWVLPVELTNGITFTLAFVSGISYAAKVAPVGSEGTLQGLFGMAFQGIGERFCADSRPRQIQCPIMTVGSVRKI